MSKGSNSAPSGQDALPFGLTLISVLVPTLVLASAPFIVRYGVPWLWWSTGSLAGKYLRHKTEGRRTHILEVMAEDEKKYQDTNKSDSKESIVRAFGGALDSKKEDDKWDGVVGFFHPFCNAGGGGERVLWAAIRATQQQWPKARIVVYTGDHEANKEQILSRVKNRFNILLHAPTIEFMYLSMRSWVLASAYPRFTLAGQSFGSIVLAWDAFSLMVPDVFVDTMGYAFALGFCRWLFPQMPTGAYVHYPTISTDMLESLDPNSTVGAQGVNAGKGVGLRGTVKRWYWMFFAWVYSMMGSTVDVVMTNSSWTQAHVKQIWGPRREAKGRTDDIVVVYPPCAVEELEEAVEVSEASESKRGKILLYIAQFRPEKNHQLVLQAFSDFKKTGTEATKGARLVLVGSVRDDVDSKRVYKLRLAVRELHIQDEVEFHLDAPWPDILEWLGKASIGVNGMWNEHFGIGVVEYQASGLISVVHDSGGPKLDIVTKIDGQPTGFHATTETEFAEGFEKALSLPDPLAWRLRARESSKRFGDEIFATRWVDQMTILVAKAA